MVNRYLVTVATGEIRSSKVNMRQRTGSRWQHLVLRLPRGIRHSGRTEGSKAPEQRTGVNAKKILTRW
jgi:hypothetical protein